MEGYSKGFASVAGGVGISSGVIIAEKQTQSPESHLHLTIQDSMMYQSIVDNSEIGFMSAKGFTDEGYDYSTLIAPETRSKSRVKRSVGYDDNDSVQNGYVAYDSVYRGGGMKIENVDSGEIFKWCNNSDRNKEDTRYKFWCEVRESTFETLANKTFKRFEDSDYESILKDLEEKKFEQEKRFLEKTKADYETLSDAAWSWCTTIREIPFWGDEEILSVVKKRCFDR